MVFILDEGSIFDAPLDKIWRFFQTGGEQHRHGSMTNPRIEMEGNSVILSFDAESPTGEKKVHVKIKSTSFPPVGRIMEYVEGPLAGSKAVSYYIPMGQKTGITMVGEWNSNVLPENRIKDVVLAQMERSFNEDQENLRNFK